MSNEEGRETCVIQYQNAETWLDRVLENYAMMTAMIMAAMMRRGKRIEAGDLEPVNEMIRTLAMISSLVESERKRISDPRGDSAKQS